MPCARFPHGNLDRDALTAIASAHLHGRIAADQTTAEVGVDYLDMHKVRFAVNDDWLTRRCVVSRAPDWIRIARQPQQSY